MLWSPGPPKASEWTSVHAEPSRDAHTAAFSSPVDASVPTATKPGPPSATAAIPWSPGSLGTEASVHDWPFAENHAAASRSVDGPLYPTATAPESVASTRFIVWLPEPPNALEEIRR